YAETQSAWSDKRALQKRPRGLVEESPGHAPIGDSRRRNAGSALRDDWIPMCAIIPLYRSVTRNKAPFSWSHLNLVLAFLPYGSVNQRSRSPHSHSLLPPADYHRNGGRGAGTGVAAIRCRSGTYAAIRMVRHERPHPGRRRAHTEQNDGHTLGSPPTSARPDGRGGLLAQRSRTTFTRCRRRPPTPRSRGNLRSLTCHLCDHRPTHRPAAGYRADGRPARSATAGSR